MSEIISSSAIDPDLQALLLDLEARFNRERAGFAENAFGIGCRAVFLPVVLAIGLVFLLGARGWVAFFLTLFSASLVAFVLVSLFANQAQSNAARRIFRETIRPELAACQQRFSLSQAELLAVAAAVLPAEAALRSYLDLPELQFAHISEEPPLPPAGDS
jgi:hypothetical protein